MENVKDIAPINGDLNVAKYEVDNISWDVLFLSRKHRKINSVGSYS